MGYNDCQRSNEAAPINFADLVTHLPVGVCKFLMDGKFTMLYANQFLYELFGYTPEQFKNELNNEICRTYFEDDFCVISSQLNQAVQDKLSSFKIEHRIKQRDGRAIWVLVSGYFIPGDDVRTGYCVVVDITDRKKMEERLRIDEERFRLALAQTDNTIFDYDIAAKVMIHADKSAEDYGLAHKTANVPDSLVESQIVHPDTAPAFLEMYRQIRTGAPCASCVTQTRLSDGRYVWRKITMTNIFDQDGNPVRAVGMLEDIDEQTRREEQLLKRSQRDPLTGLYNKGATEEQITQLLDHAQCGALLIIDVDSFKAINDHFGHLFGDLVLSEIAHRIATLCRHEDIVGRIGGDEFLLYLTGIFTKDVVLRKAEEICNAFIKAFSHNSISTHITCTVGLALCPIDGTSFEVLYQKADVALYSAKRNGKNSYCLYDASMNGQIEWVPYSSTKIDEPVVCMNS